MFRVVFLFLLAASLVPLGCRKPTTAGKSPASIVRQAKQSGGGGPSGEQDKQAQPWPEKITNQFGMTFCLVEVDPTKWEHLPTYPSKAYYLQQTELDFPQHQAFRTAAFGEGRYETIDWHFNSGFPGEWREVQRYAAALSKFDTQYDYRLPTLSEWTFACKDGYDQKCPKHQSGYAAARADGMPPNKFAIFGLDNNNVECGDIPGLFFGRHGRPNQTMDKPDCCCDWWTKGNPEADDGLNELITARFVLELQR